MFQMTIPDIWGSKFLLAAHAAFFLHNMTLLTWGGNPKDDIRWHWGGGVQEGQNIAYVIYEQPLIINLFYWWKVCLIPVHKVLWVVFFSLIMCLLIFCLFQNILLLSWSYCFCPKGSDPFEKILFPLAPGLLFYTLLMFYYIIHFNNIYPIPQHFK